MLHYEFISNASFGLSDAHMTSCDIAVGLRSLGLGIGICFVLKRADIMAGTVPEENKYSLRDAQTICLHSSAQSYWLL